MGPDAAQGAAGHALRFLSNEPKSRVIAVYAPIKSELDARFLARDLDRHGFDLALPVVTAQNEPLLFRRWGPEDPLIDGPFGTTHPEDKAPTVVPDLAFVPLLGFDDGGTRLGYGGGYYDRTLAAHPSIRAFGYGFAAQLVDHIPRSRYDIPMHAVVTEAGVLVPGARKLESV